MQTSGFVTRTSPGLLSSAAIKEEKSCPLYQGDLGICLASDLPLKVTASRRRRCCSDDHDDCSTYLGYLLRHTTPLRNDNDWLDAR